MDISNKIVPAYLSTDNGNIMVIQEKEMLLYSKMNQIVKIFAILGGEEEKPKWVLEFQIKGESERALLVTSLNEPRYFPNLNFMAATVRLWCPQIETIELGINRSTN